MDDEIKNKKREKAQVTFFIILGLIIVVSIVLFFLLRGIPKMEIIDENNPQAYIESCAREAVEEALGILSPQGGDIKPKGSILYNNTDITYLCYNINFYERCVNQRPLLDNHIEQEITNYITPIVADCFQTMEAKFKKRYDIETSELRIETSLYPEQIQVDIYKYFKMSREDKLREFNHFKMNMVHPIYNFAEIAMEIVNQETKYCDFDLLGYSILYPRYDFNEIMTGDGDIIYTIKEIVTGQEFKFAIRNCVLPPGY